jgi:5'-nucleotidase
MPNILLTNDDGYQASGLRELERAMQGLGTIYIVAPMEEQSGKAQSLTLRRPIYVEQTGERAWAVGGTPADCMILALNRLLPARPDLVVSGINSGGNMGENVYYSGTVAAAMEATINNIPAIAVSVAYKGKDFHFEPAGRLAHRVAEKVLSDSLPRGVLLNVNVPNEWNGRVRITRQSEKITRNVLKEDVDPVGRLHYWLHEQTVREGMAPDSDYAAIFDGAASITPLQLDRTHDLSLNHLSAWARDLEIVLDH